MAERRPYRYRTAYRNARPKRFFDGLWYAPDGRGRWRCDARKPRYVFLHRAVWEHHHGPLARGCVVLPKDGNYMNCEISNLRCERVRCWNPWILWRKGLRAEPPVDQTYAKRTSASRAFWARMTAGEREMYCLFRALARRDASERRQSGQKLLQMAAAGGAIHGHAG